MKSLPNRVLNIIRVITCLIMFAGSGQFKARAQTPNPEGPVYLVQEGDTLWSIAARFRISMADLATANGIGDTSQTCDWSTINYSWSRWHPRGIDRPDSRIG